MLHITGGDRFGGLERPVGERGFPVVDMRDDGEIAGVFKRCRAGGYGTEPRLRQLALSVSDAPTRPTWRFIATSCAFDPKGELRDAPFCGIKEGRADRADKGKTPWSKTIGQINADSCKFDGARRLGGLWRVAVFQRCGCGAFFALSGAFRDRTNPKGLFGRWAAGIEPYALWLCAGCGGSDLVPLRSAAGGQNLPRSASVAGNAPIRQQKSQRLLEHMESLRPERCGGLLQHLIA